MEDPPITAAELTWRAALSALGRKAEDLVILDVREIVSYAQFFVICHGHSNRQVSAIAEAIRAEVKTALNEVPLGIEGMETGRWVLVDYGDVVVHVFDEHLRRFYDLEALWIDAPRIQVPEHTHADAPAPAFA
jgi:ribosome-associated protein